MSFESFKLARDMKDEADELSAAGKKKGLAGAVGGIGGALLLPLLLNPVTLAGAAVAAGVGSIAGNVVGRNLLAPKATKVLSGEDAKFYGKERQEFKDNLNTEMLTSGLTTALTAGGSEFLKNFSKVPGVFDENLVKQAGELVIEGVEIGDKIKIGQRIQLAGGPDTSWVGKPFTKEGKIYKGMVDDKGLFQGGKEGRLFGRAKDKIFAADASSGNTQNLASNTIKKPSNVKTISNNKVSSNASSKVNEAKESLDALWDEVKLGKYRDKYRKEIQEIFKTSSSRRNM